MLKLDEAVVTDIVSLVTVSSPKGRSERIRNRKCYGISFCTEGQIIYTKNSEQYVSDKDHAIILPEGQTYSLYGSKKGLFPVINFKSLYPICDEICVLPISNLEAYLHDYEQMKALSLFENNRTKVISILYSVIHRLSTENLGSSGILSPAVVFIEKNYSSPEINNAILASKCNISEVYFRKLFTERFGVSPRQYITEIRINKAKQLLSEGGIKINSVSEKCGFSNPYHFCRVFRQKTGMTPTDYMKENKIYKI